MRKEWLQSRITVTEAEQAHLVQHDRLGPEPIPFGFDNGRWRSLIVKMQAGDELWEFCTSQKSWEAMAGRAGIALVRDGKVIDSIVTMMN